MPTLRTPSSSIAPHLREHIFRTYEPYLHAAVTAWPDPIWFDVPPKLASATFIAGIRNAVISVERYSWETVINVEKLRTISGSANTPRAFIIALADDGKVWFRSPQVGQRPAITVSSGQGDPVSYSAVRPAAPLHRPGKSLPLTSVPSPPSLVPWRDHTEEQISALCLLLHHSRIVGPYLIDGEVCAGLIDELQTKFNVALVYDEAAKQTVIT